MVELVRHFKIFRTKYFSFGSFLYDSSDHIYRSKNGENSLFSAISKCTYNANFDFSVRQITLGQKFSSSLIFTKSKFYSLTREKMRRCRRRWAWAINLFFASPFHSAFVWFFLCSPHYHYVEDSRRWQKMCSPHYHYAFQHQKRNRYH